MGLTELEIEEASHDLTLSQRDHAEAMANKLTESIAEYFEVEFGEHSSNNCPWINALNNMGVEITSKNSGQSVDVDKIIALIRRGPKESDPVSRINTAECNQAFIDELREMVGAV